MTSPTGRSDLARRPSPVVAVVLNWNNLPDTLECVGSLLRSDYEHLQVLIVDNNSHEDPTPVLQHRYPGVKVVRTPRNLGYGGGNNSGIRWAIGEGADYVLILNNDATVAPDTVGLLVGAVQADPRIGMATPRVFYFDRPEEVYWDGGVIDWETGDTPHDSRNLPSDDRVKRSEWLDGSALLVRVAAISDIGLFDDRYFLYFEDAEWSVRAARRGWLNAVVLRAHAWHKVSKTTGGTSNPAVRFYYSRNRYLFMRTHRPLSAGFLWRARYLFRLSREYAAVRDDQDGRKATLAALLSILRGHWGPYDATGNDRRVDRTLDALLSQAAKAAGGIKRLLVGSARAAR